ncbi:hypothetical protein MTO96_024856 [Rhipicephalus appendiculatus]
MQPSATVMNRKSLVNQIDILYREQKASLIAALEKASTVCCTADCWTASNRSFLGVTVHFIDEQSLERRSAELVCQRLSGRHTYDVIATALHAVFVEYKILHKICVVITDNGSNFVKAFRVFGEAERDQDFVANNITEVLDSGSSNDSSQDIHLPRHRRCAAHTLNLVCRQQRDLPRNGEDRFLKTEDSLEETRPAMYAVAKALHILQGEQYMYMGVLQPTLHSLLRYQRSLPPLKYCTPLASSLQDAVKKRFSGVLEDADLALAAAVHPKFKLFLDD